MVKLLIYLKSENNCTQKNFSKKYNSAMKGFIFKKLKDSKYALDKNNSNFRGLSFSNLFPIKNAKIEFKKIYKVYVTSVYPELIMFLLTKLNIEDKVNFGEASFEIVDLKLIRDDVVDNCIIKSSTMISVKTKDDSGNSVFIDYEKE